MTACVLVFGAQDVSISRHDFILEMLGMWKASRDSPTKVNPSQVKRVQPNQVLEGAAVLRADWLWLT